MFGAVMMMSTAPLPPTEVYGCLETWVRYCIGDSATAVSQRFKWRNN